MATEHGDGSYTAGVSLLAATFSPSQAENMFFGGDYEGVIVDGGYSHGRFAGGASWAYYRLARNGVTQYGVGDLVVHGQAALVAEDDLQIGGMIAVSVPTGDDALGLGMGHTMLMPAGYATWRTGRTELAASFGYSRALASGMHVHGMAPLVDPMNMSELTWSGDGSVAIAAGIRVGARLSGGFPVGAMPGSDRIVGALRVAWRSGRVDTGAEMQAGLSGDPFNVRGVVSSTLRF